MKSNAIAFFVCCLMPVFSSSVGAGCIDSVDMSRLRESVANHSEFYGDLPDRINCTKPVGNQQIVCQSDVLRFMEKLDHMATVYAEENGTKRELDHSNTSGSAWLNKMLKKCRSEECVCREYKKSADESLSGLSPYQ